MRLTSRRKYIEVFQTNKLYFSLNEKQVVIYDEFYICFASKLVNFTRKQK